MTTTRRRHPLLLLSYSVVLISTCSTALSVSCMKPRILCVGVAGIDFVANVPHFPEPDEKMRSTSLLVDGGGNAANTACSMGRLSDRYVGEVSLVTAIGDDANGNTILDGLKENHVDTKYVERYKGTSAFTYVIASNNEVSGNARTCIHQPATQDMSVEFIKEIPVGAFTAAHFDIRHPEAAVPLAKNCVEAGIPYSVDVERPRDGLLELMADATIVICSTNFCDAILGPSDKETSDKEIVSRLNKVMEDLAPNAAIAVSTLGGRGSCLVRLKGEPNYGDGPILEDEEDSNVPVVTSHDGAIWCSAWGGCKVVDSTGAGDSFQGGFLSALWSYAAANGGISAFSSTSHVPMDTPVLAHALRIGTRVSGMKLGALGARQGLPYADNDEWLQSEFDTLLARATEKVQVP